jgi:hypothetical protein
VKTTETTTKNARVLAERWNSLEGVRNAARRRAQVPILAEGGQRAIWRGDIP